MNAQENVRVPTEQVVRGWLAAYEADLPLFRQFPLRLVNGKSISGIHVVCTLCGDRLSGKRVRGRVIQSLPHVVTVTANGMCECCDRLTHIDCRFRALRHATVVEWLRTNGQWQAREIQPTSLSERVWGLLRRAGDAMRAW